MGLAVFVQNGESTISLDCESSDTILAVKSKVEIETAIPPNQQQLTFNDTLLLDGNTISSYNIQKNSTLILTIISVDIKNWGKIDAYTEAPLHAITQVFKEPKSDNMGPSGSGKLFENATESDLITNETVGLFNYTTSETQSSKIAHTGWVLKTTGSGGRAGRVQYETLVCLTSNVNE
jgi:ubiquitin C